MQVKFTILGEPKGKGRPRFSRKTGTAITPKDTVNYETLVHMEYLEEDENQPDTATDEEITTEEDGEAPGGNPEFADSVEEDDYEYDDPEEEE